MCSLEFHFQLGAGSARNLTARRSSRAERGISSVQERSFVAPLLRMTNGKSSFVATLLRTASRLGMTGAARVPMTQYLQCPSPS
jgi:hypothetical protein